MSNIRKFFGYILLIIGLVFGVGYFGLYFMLLGGVSQIITAFHASDGGSATIGFLKIVFVIPVTTIVTIIFMVPGAILLND